MESRAAHDRGQRRLAIALITCAELATMALWFSATAAVPALQRSIGLDPAFASWFTNSVQAGFVVGTLTSAAFALSDRIDPRNLFAGCALAGAGLNALLLIIPPESGAFVAARFLTGASLAGVYPVGMRLMATWARDDLGLLIGLLVAALTVGSASPHLFNALGGVQWQIPILASTASAILGAGLVRAAPVGPAGATGARFDPAAAFRACSQPAVRLAIFGYLGHMWESMPCGPGSACFSTPPSA